MRSRARLLLLLAMGSLIASAAGCAGGSSSDRGRASVYYPGGNTARDAFPATDRGDYRRGRDGYWGRPGGIYHR